MKCQVFINEFLKLFSLRLLCPAEFASGGDLCSPVRALSTSIPVIRQLLKAQNAYPISEFCRRSLYLKKPGRFAMETTKNAWINILFFVVTLLVNALGALGFINGLSQKDVSDMFETLITPSPATFSIWGVIYALLLLTVIVMLVKRDHPYDKKTINQITALSDSPAC